MTKKIKKNLKKSYKKDLEKSNGEKPKKNYEKYQFYLTLIIVVIYALLFLIAFLSYRKTAKLFVGQNKPLIDVTPIGIVQVGRDDGTKMCATLYSVVNYSGFDAYNIAYDIKYGSDWISEWVKADDNRKEKVEKRVTLNHLYISRPKVIIPKLMPGETIGGDFKWPPDASGELDFKWPPPHASGEFDLEVHVVDKDEGFPVLMRVTWENESGHVFDEIHKYKLLCTDVGPGLSFTFIPEGIISQKNIR